MTGFIIKNNTESTVADNPLAQAAVTLNVPAGEGARFPSTFPFRLTIWDEEAHPDPTNDSGMEIVECTARTTDALTIVRAKEGTADVAHANGERVALLITAGLFNDASRGVITKLDTIEDSATADQTGAEIKTAYEAEANAFTDTKNTKLSGIEESATADQTADDIETLIYHSRTDAVEVTDDNYSMELKLSEKITTLEPSPCDLKIGFYLRRSSANGAKGQVYRNGTPVGTLQSTSSQTYVYFEEVISGWNQGDTIQIYARSTQSGGYWYYVKSLTVKVNENIIIDGRDIDADHTKLDGIETAATADQTGAEIKTAYQAEANAYTDTKNTKLTGIATGADVTADNAPQAHAASVHTDRTRHIWISTPHFHTGGAETYGIALDASVDKAWYCNFSIPKDFVSIGNIYVYYFADVGSGDVVLSINTYYGAAGESKSTHVNSDTGNVITISDTNRQRFQTSGLCASAAIDDIVLINIARDANNAADTNTGDFVINGIMIEYTADM